MSTFGIRKTLSSSFEETLVQLPEALKSEGFGVLTEIDIQNTLKQKLGVEFRKYKIFGACNPPLAHEALQTEIEIGLMLPCNVVVFENDEHQTVVIAVDPTKTMAGSGEPQLMILAQKVKDKLQKVIAKLS
jgi:uncharacterized protein (DUF302 family)